MRQPPFSEEITAYLYSKIKGKKMLTHGNKQVTAAKGLSAAFLYIAQA